MAPVWRATLGIAMAELDDIARRAVDSVDTTRDAGGQVRRLRCSSPRCSIGADSFLLGLAALDGGIRTVWIVLGLVFGAMAIGSVVRGPLAAGRSGEAPSEEIVAEVRSLLELRHPATRTMIDTVEADERQASRVGARRVA